MQALQIWCDKNGIRWELCPNFLNFPARMAFVLEEDFEVPEIVIGPKTEESLPRTKLLESCYRVHERHAEENCRGLVLAK